MHVIARRASALSERSLDDSWVPTEENGNCSTLRQELSKGSLSESLLPIWSNRIGRGSEVVATGSLMKPKGAAGVQGWSGQSVGCGKTGPVLPSGLCPMSARDKWARVKHRSLALAFSRSSVSSRGRRGLSVTVIVSSRGACDRRTEMQLQRRWQPCSRCSGRATGGSPTLHSRGSARRDPLSRTLREASGRSREAPPAGAFWCGLKCYSGANWG